MNKTAKQSLIPELIPREADTKYYGNEPIFAIQPDSDARLGAIARGFRWYNRYYGRKDALQLLAQFLDVHDREREAKLLRKVAENELMLSFCWLARMSLRGLHLTEHEELAIQGEISRLLHTLAKPEGAINPDNTLDGEEVRTNKPNIQEVMLEKAREMGGELEGLLDEYLNLGAVTKHSIRPIDTIARANILAHHITMLLDQWRSKVSEYEEATRGTDEQLTEGYSNFTKTQLKNLVKFCELVIADLNGYANIKRANKAPRKKKAVPVYKTVSKLKHLKEFQEFNLKSVPATQVHGASEVYLFDTKTRKLIYYVADEHIRTLSVKNSSLLGYDQTKSYSKTLRQPEKQLKEFMKLGKPAGRKYMKEIKTVETELKGRTNDNMIILKCN